MGILDKYFRLSRHTKLALIMAPILLVGGYIAADYYESRQDADDQVYQMEKKSVCNLRGAGCEFTILEFEVALSAKPTESGGSLFVLKTSEAVQAVNLEVLHGGESDRPRSMLADSNDVNKWVLDSPVPFGSVSEFHLVISTGKAFLFAEAKW